MTRNHKDPFAFVSLFAHQFVVCCKLRKPPYGPTYACPSLSLLDVGVEGSCASTFQGEGLSASFWLRPGPELLHTKMAKQPQDTLQDVFQAPQSCSFAFGSSWWPLYSLLPTDQPLASLSKSICPATCRWLPQAQARTDAERQAVTLLGASLADD